MGLKEEPEFDFNGMLKSEFGENQINKLFTSRNWTNYFLLTAMK
jgi:hypothetical protein